MCTPIRLCIFSVTFLKLNIVQTSLYSCVFIPLPLQNTVSSVPSTVYGITDSITEWVNEKKKKRMTKSGWVELLRVRRDNRWMLMETASRTTKQEPVLPSLTGPGTVDVFQPHGSFFLGNGCSQGCDTSGAEAGTHGHAVPLQLSAPSSLLS